MMMFAYIIVEGEKRMSRYRIAYIADIDVVNKKALHDLAVSMNLIDKNVQVDGINEPQIIAQLVSLQANKILHQGVIDVAPDHIGNQTTRTIYHSADDNGRFPDITINGGPLA
jgi:hypothetical protein